MQRYSREDAEVTKEDNAARVLQQLGLHNIAASDITLHRASGAALELNLNGTNGTENVLEIVEETTPARCYTYEEAMEFCREFDNSTAQESRSGGVDDDEPEDVTSLLESWAQRNGSKSIASGGDWRQGPMRDRNRYLLKEQLLTDCTFIVGPDPDPQTIRAHKLLLQRASSLFEAIFNSSGDRPVRVSDVSPPVFTALLEFLYTGEVCLEDFDQVCELASVAARFEIPALVQRSRAFLWASLYPSNVWRAYKCAMAANDTKLQAMALQVAQRRTDEALMDPKFAEIPQEALVAFLSQDSLNVKSEVQLLDASVRWALSEVMRRNLPPKPESLREALGSALGLIRFLTLTPKQFADNQLTSQILTCTERLAILYNLNSPRVIPLPSGISEQKKSRKSSGEKTYMDVVVFNSSICKNDSLPLVKNAVINKNTFDLFSTNIQAISSSRAIRGVNIPTQVKVKSDGTTDLSSGTYMENITVFVVNAKNQVQSIAQFQGSVSYNSLLLVRFTESITLNTCSSEVTCQQFRVRFGTPGRYPTMYTGAGVQTAGTLRHEHVNTFGYTYVLYLGEEFIYSVVVS
ncbi:hypothetical protein B566_EDAN001434 [Ephemera danica]|nr:hypothetical protein B566_EDAN001434 [Ephemera danica]